MIKAITITNPLSGEAITVNLGDIEPYHGLFITEIEGLGPPKADINMTSLATKDGSLYNSSRANNRNIVLHVRFINAASIEDVRLLTYRYFHIKKKITFTIETDNRLASISGYVESNEPDIFSPEESATISIVCESSWFIDEKEGRGQHTEFSDVISLFEFEFEDPDEESPSIEFASIETKRQNLVYYKGDAETGFLMRMFISGSITNPKIFDLTTNETIAIDTTKVAAITGGAVGAGDEIQINSVVNEKSIVLIRNGIRYNILNALDIDTTWFKLQPGDNMFGYTADSGELNIIFRMEYDTLLQGV